jgi:hypothetical protein
MSSEKALSALTIVSASVLILSLVWLSAAFPVMNAPGILYIDLLDWPLDGATSTLTRESRWMSGVGAGLLAGLATMLLLVVIPELRKGNSRVKRGAMLSLVVWYLVDGTGSIAAGVMSNVFFNTVFLIMLLWPMRVIRTK